MADRNPTRARTTAGPTGRHTLLTSRDIAALNRARAVLKRLEQTAWKRSLSHYDPFAPVTAWDLGRVSEAASAADDAIFHVLATARANCHVKLTDAQLFGPDPVHELAQADGQAHHGAEPADAPAAEGEPASAEQEQAIEAEPPTPQDGSTDVARPRRPIHAV
jgi:hypothetical protein